MSNAALKMAEKVAQRGHYFEQRVEQQTNIVLSTLENSVENEHKLADMRLYAYNIPVHIEKFQSYLNLTSSLFGNLADLQFHVPQHMLKLHWQLLRFPSLVHQKLGSCKLKWRAEQNKLTQNFRAEKNLFGEKLTNLRMLCKKCEATTTEHNLSIKSIEICGLLEEFELCKTTVKNFQFREKVFELEPREYVELDSLVNRFTDCFRFWILFFDVLSHHEGWMTQSFRKLSYNSIVDQINTWNDSLTQFSRSLGCSSNHKLPIDSLQKKMSTFVGYLPIIESLSNSAIFDRHWKHIFTLAPVLEPVDDQLLSLEKFIELDAFKYLDEIRAVCAIAVNEHRIDAEYKMIKAKFQQLRLSFEMVDNTHLIVEWKFLVQLLHDLEVDANKIQFSKYLAPIQAEFLCWKTKLHCTREYVTSVIATQHQWQETTKMLRIRDSKVLMPQKYAICEQFDTTFRNLVVRLVEFPNISLLLKDEQSKLFADQAKELASQIQTFQCDYLAMKKPTDPRLYFVPNPLLIAYFSSNENSHLPEIVKHALRGISKLIMDNTDRIVGIKTHDGKIFHLLHNLPHESTLEQLANSIAETIHTLISNAVGEKFNSLPKQFYLVLEEARLWYLLEDMIVTQSTPNFKELAKKFHSDCEQLYTKLNNEPAQHTVYLEQMISMQMYFQSVLDQLAGCAVPVSSSWVWQKCIRRTISVDEHKLTVCGTHYNYGNQLIHISSGTLPVHNSDQSFFAMYQGLHNRIVMNPLSKCVLHASFVLQQFSSHNGRELFNLCIAKNDSMQRVLRSIYAAYSTKTWLSISSTYESSSTKNLELVDCNLADLIELYGVLPENNEAKFFFSKNSHVGRATPVTTVKYFRPSILLLPNVTLRIESVLSILGLRYFAIFKYFC